MIVLECLMIIDSHEREARMEMRESDAYPTVSHAVCSHLLEEPHDQFFSLIRTTFTFKKFKILTRSVLVNEVK